jgi:hypothetical protein
MRPLHTERTDSPPTLRNINNLTLLILTAQTAKMASFEGLSADCVQEPRSALGSEGNRVCIRSPGSFGLPAYLPPPCNHG